MTINSKMNHNGWLVLLTGMLLFAACETDPILTGDEVSYAADIRRLIDQNCTSSGCHGAGSVVSELLTYNQVKLDADKIRRVIWIERDTPHHNVSLSDADRKKFKDWVDAGAPNN